MESSRPTHKTNPRLRLGSSHSPKGSPKAVQVYSRRPGPAALISHNNPTLMDSNVRPLAGPLMNPLHQLAPTVGPSITRDPINRRESGREETPPQQALHRETSKSSLERARKGKQTVLETPPAMRTRRPLESGMRQRSREESTSPPVLRRHRRALMIDSG